MRFLACALLVITTTYATKVCEPGTSKHEGPNVCFCLGDGSGWTCTPDSSTKALPSNPLIRETREVKETQDRCEPGKSFKYYCNSCFCGIDGLADHAACTLIDCDTKMWNKDGSLKYPNEVSNNKLQPRVARVLKKVNEDTCEPGKRFNYYCNPCFCGNDGKVVHSVCTKMECDPAIWNKDGSLKHPNGIPTNPLLRESQEIKENEDTCEPGERFNYYCNSCSCGADGTVRNSACTKKYCDPAIWNKDGSLRRSNEIANNPLLRKEREARERCEPGRHFMDYCNTCICGNDGLADHAACTQMLCDPTEWNKDGTPKVTSGKLPLLANQPSGEFLCQPGKTYKDDCNTCVCNSDGKSSSCTKMLCPPRENAPAAPKVCEPGKNFKIDCNQCICSGDGLKVACTKMACDVPNDARNKRSELAADGTNFCQPNTTFKKNCNTCRCNRDGSAAVCTLMECP